jgi:RNase P/RNase MRP subunit p29
MQRLSDSEFSVVFPTRQTLKLSTGSGKLHLPLSKTDTEIR